MKRALSELEQDDDSTPQAKKVKLNKPLCKYGANCYRKNPQASIFLFTRVKAICCSVARQNDQAKTEKNR